MDRRAFLKCGIGTLWFASLSELSLRRAYAADPAVGPYGPIGPKIDETTGLPLLQLPDGFRYLSYAWTGDGMSDGLRCPPRHDGMAVIGRQGASSSIVLVRNHEVESPGPFTANTAITYVAGGGGGTTNLMFDTAAGRWVKAWATLAGTRRNCAGGVTPWGTWVTGEETMATGHGWAFEVGLEKGSPKPLREMGRFVHEAMMVDPVSGFVYETEDAPDCGFYRFVPKVARALADGGELFMLKVKNRPNVNLGLSVPAGTVWPLEWVRIDDPFANTVPVFQQGAAKGGARFRRLEGAWWGARKGFFVSTSGGGPKKGQVFAYDPAAETLTLIYDAPAVGGMDHPDNITVTPRGGLLLCEDDDGIRRWSMPPNRLMGLTLDGKTFPFAANNMVLGKAFNDWVRAGDYRRGEWAGACYSPDGNWLFANIQMPGITFAIKGPWGKGPL